MLKIILFTVLGLLGLILLLLCAPVVLLIKYASVTGEFELTVRYLLIPVRLLPKDERSILTKLEKLSAWIKESKTNFRIRFRNFMLCRRPTRAVYRWFGCMSERAEQRRKERRLAKLKKKKKKARQDGKTEEKEKSAFGKLIEQRGITGMISWFIELSRIAAGMTGKIFRGIIIRRLDLLMDIGGEDAAQAAINYGRMCALVLPALSLILSAVRRYRRRIELRPDFEDEGIKASLDTELVIFPIAVLGHALMALLRILFGEIKRAVRERMEQAGAANNQAEA